jgi:hypothetical protein
MSPITDWEALAKDAKSATTSYEPAPEGNYNLTITEAKVEVVPSSGNTKFATSMVIDSGPFKGKRVWHDFVVARENKKALSIFFGNMSVFGMPFEFFNANTPDESIVANMVNKRLSADLIVDRYNPEKPKNKIDKGWTIKAATGVSELDLPSAAGVPGGAGPAVTNAPPPQNNYQAAPPQQYQQQPPAQPQYQQPPQQYQEQPPATNMQPDVDPWQTPSAPPPPPSNANWGAPPPPPPGLN